MARVEGDRAVVSVLVKRRVGGRRRVRAAHLVELGQAPGHTRSSIVNGMATGTRACVTSMGTGPSVELRIHGLEMNGCGHEANERCENAPKKRQHSALALGLRAHLSSTVSTATNPHRSPAAGECT